MSADIETRDRARAGSSGPAPTTFEGASLVVFERGSSTVVPLPESGTMIVGREPPGEGDLAVDDETVSRRHARIRCEEGQVSIVDLGSRNGTRVNGELLRAVRPLSGGEAIAVGDVILVFRAAASPPVAAPAGGVRDWLRRLAEEIERWSAYHLRARGAPAVIVVALGAPVVDRAAVEQAIRGCLRIIDLPAWGTDTELLFVVPELDEPAARDTARRLLDALSPHAPSAGLAVAARDGCDAETLLAVARAAAAGAERGALATGADTLVTHVLVDGAPGRKSGAREHRVVCADPQMIQLFSLIRRLAARDLPVLILGESGTGKELAARAVHAWSARAQGRFVAVNCGAMPETLLDSVLFGHAKGAFSGAAGDKAGLLESAGGGTVFLDEIGDATLAVQVKLLRALQEGRIYRVGENEEREIDVRVVAATNRDLAAEVKAGRFREDLYYRLNVARVVMVPLRRRPREIPILARTFLDEACARNRGPGKPAWLSPATLHRLARYPWPGNVRELENAIASAETLADAVIEPWHLPYPLWDPAPPATPSEVPAVGRPLDEEIAELRQARLEQALVAAGGNVSEAARLLGKSLRAVQNWVKGPEMQSFIQRIKREGGGSTEPEGG